MRPPDPEGDRGHYMSSPAKLGRDIQVFLLNHKKKGVTKLKKVSPPEIDDRVEMPQK